jgi:TRAP-type transport system small permease protein
VIGHGKRYGVWDYLGGSLVLLVVGVTFLQVIGRYCLQLTYAWPDELTRYLFIWMVMIGSVAGMISGGHFVLGLLGEVARGNRLYRAALTTVELLGCAFLLLLVWHGARLAYAVRLQETPAMQISMAWVYAAVPVGALAMFAYAVRRLARRLRQSG